MVLTKLGLDIQIDPLFQSTTVKLLGFVMFALGIMLTIPSFVALAIGEDPLLFGPLAVLMLIAGSILYLLFSQSQNFRSVNGLLLVGLSWLLVFAVGALPFYFADFHIIDSLFESVSGFTTTGASVVTDPGTVNHSLLLWRSLTQWVGGLMVILIFMYMLPSFGIGRNIFLNELSGSGSSTFFMKITNAARNFIIVYFIMTMANFVALMICGADLMDSTTLALTTISTGGMIASADSMMSFPVSIQLVTLVFMFLGGLNFYLHYTTIFKRTLSAYRTSSELRMITIWFIVSSVFIYILLMANVPGAIGFDLEEHLGLLKDATFTTVSMGTTAGFYVVDYCQFPSQCIVLLFLVTFFGASAGSTSGGVKFGRLILLYQFVKNSVGKILNPNMVFTVKVDGEPVDNNMVMSAICIFIMYTVTLLAGAFCIMMYGYGFVDSIGLSLSSLTNVGLGFGDFGPGTSADMLPTGVKTVMMVLMWLGRLEIVMALAFITPSFWREVWLNYRSKKRARIVKARKSDRSQ